MSYETNILLAACLRRIIKATPPLLLPHPPSFSSICRQLDVDRARQREKARCLSRRLPRVEILSTEKERKLVYRLRWL